MRAPVLRLQDVPLPLREKLAQGSSRRGRILRALLLANSAYAGGLPSPTNVDDMEKRKMAREEILKAARAKAAAQAAPAAAPEAAAPPASE